MDRGIRPFCNAKFMYLLPTRVNSREGNVKFRKDVMGAVMEAFGATLASAATHYNHSFIEARKLGANDPTIAALLVGLGRPEDKKGGRKPKAKAEQAPDGAAPASPEPPPPAEEGATAESNPETAGEELNSTEVKGDVAWPHAEGYTAPTYTVSKKDGTVVASGLTKEQADELIAKAKASKKGTLEATAENAPQETPAETSEQEAAPAQ
jgi:hypothetical protein